MALEPRKSQKFSPSKVSRYMVNLQSVEVHLSVCLCVQEILDHNQCSEAYWLGNLKNRDIQVCIIGIVHEIWEWAQGQSYYQQCDDVYMMFCLGT